MDCDLHPDQPVESGQLGQWNTSGLEQGPYTLRLTVLDKKDAQTTFTVVMNLNSSPIVTTTPGTITTPSFVVPGPTATPRR